MPPTRSPYNGQRRKLILAFDIGTTFSGVSYSILDPGLVPEIKGVTRFPCQEHVGGDSKIPTIIYYDGDGNVRAVGAEAVKEGIEDLIEEEGWTKAEWFKLHLRPKSSSSADVTQKIPPLPKNKAAIDLFADFMKYLYECARTYIQDTHANGPDIWTSLEKQQDIEFVLTHPNGWEGAQQAQMRRAAARGGLVPHTNKGRARVHFVTEGEASLHFCIQSGLTTTALENGEGILIIDAGGGTIDMSAYGRTSISAQSSFQEVTAPQCFFKGSVFVTHHAGSFLEKLLLGSKYHDDVEYITSCFDKTTKLRFRNEDEPQYIKFGTARDKDLKLGIRSGQLKLLGTDVASFFKPSIECIIKAIFEQRNSSSKSISSIFLVGGFAASDWLFSRIKDSLEPSGVRVCRPDSHINKAVADGGVSYYIDHLVTARVAKYSYGTSCRIPYDPTDSEHVRRSNKIFVDDAGELCLPSSFSVILPKNTQVSETKQFRCAYFRAFHDIHSIPGHIEDNVTCYRGSSEIPAWTDVEAFHYTTLCTIVTKGKLFERAVIRGTTPDLRPYYKLAYDIVLSFGLTELTAHISWKENGQEKRSPAHIVYDYDVIASA